MAMGDVLLGGEIDLVGRPDLPFEDLTLDPQQTRALFEKKGWGTIVAFQTRNVPHVGHEYLQKTALAFTDGVFINPVIGKKKSGDFLDEVILDSYKALLENYYIEDRSALSILHLEMRYAGPREAIFHAIVRKNFGCTHFIVGRDHAGVGNYYEPFAAQEIFGEFPDLGITPLFFKSFFHCKKCGGVSNDKTCPHGDEHKINFVGTAIREMLTKGEVPPPEMMREEVAQAIIGRDKIFVE
jgi:sulfate adenylyltransferase